LIYYNNCHYLKSCPTTSSSVTTISNLALIIKIVTQDHYGRNSNLKNQGTFIKTDMITQLVNLDSKIQEALHPLGIEIKKNSLDLNNEINMKKKKEII
jgi:hypothetical protein